MQQFSLSGSEVAFSPAASAYRDCLVKYAKLGSEHASDFANKFDSEKESLGELLRLIVQRTRLAIDATVESVLDDLIAHGIFDVDENALLGPLHAKIEQSDVTRVWSEVFETLPDDEEYTSSGLSLIGGGFGVEGALQGVAIATTANLATSLVSSAYASARQSRDQRNAVVGMRGAQTKKKVCAALRKIVLLGNELLIETLRERGVDAFELPTSDDRRKAEAIVRNIANGRLPECAEEGALISAIKLNPYDAAPFILLKGKGRWSDGLASLAAYLDIDVEEAAGLFAADDALGSIADQVVTLETAIRSILEKHTFKDLMLDPHIPERKTKTAIEKYFNPATPPPPEAKNAEPCDPGKLIALIDCTSFGSAAIGIAFGSQGLAWNDVNKVPALLSWKAFHEVRQTLRLVFLGVGLAGSQMTVAGADVKRSALLEILTDIGELLERRMGDIETELMSQPG